MLSKTGTGAAAAYTTSVACFNDNVYYINTQTLTVNGAALDLNRSTAYIAGLVAGMEIDSSLTNQIIPNVSSVTPEYTTGNGDLGATLLSLNVPFIKCRNRRTGKYVCVNSAVPAGLDMSIYRTRDYILNILALESFLGQHTNAETVEGITNVVDNVKEQCIDLGYIDDMTYTVEKVNSSTIDVNITQMVFSGVLTKLNIYYSIGVE